MSHGSVFNHSNISISTILHSKNQFHFLKESRNILNFLLKEAGVSEGFKYKAPDMIKSSFFSKTRSVFVICAYFTTP